jgi:hypothetical protein
MFPPYSHMDVLLVFPRYVKLEGCIVVPQPGILGQQVEVGGPGYLWVYYRRSGRDERKKKKINGTRGVDRGRLTEDQGYRMSISNHLVNESGRDDASLVETDGV